MADTLDGLVNSDMPRDKNLNAINTSHHIQNVTDALTGAGAAGDSFAITVPDGALEVEVYVVDSAGALLTFSLIDIQDEPVSAIRPGTMGSKNYGCSGHTTIAGSCATGDLGDGLTATAVCIFKMGKARD